MVVMYAMTTPTMINGPAPAPLPLTSIVASTTAESGSCSIDTTPAPIPTAIAPVRSNPGRWEARRLAAAPMSIAGKVGPPRKLPSDIPHAALLKASSSSSAEIDQAPGLLTSPGNAVCPEEHLAGVLPAGRVKRDRQQRHDDPGYRNQKERTAHHDRPRSQAELFRSERKQRDRDRE